MSEETEAGQHTVSKRTMELVVAGLLIVAAGVVMADSWRIGARWASDGPEAGYFPFYIGLLMFVASAVTFVTHLRSTPAGRSSFVGREELGRVLQVLLPTIVFVVAIAYLGIYVSAALFIAYFMAVVGKYPIYKVVPVAVGVPIFLFLMFEVWFLVPLPKGPLEAALGY